MNILVIDDDFVDRTRLKHELGGEENNENIIVDASTAAEGIAEYLKQDFDVVLLDYRLPDSNGIETLKELKAMPNKGTAIIIASTIDDMDIALSCIRAGAQDFIPKNDITPSRLARAIIQAKERFTLENELKQSYEKAKYFAERDTLTGLANRYFFDNSLQLAINSNRRKDKKFSLMLLDLDNFKKVNDSYGHDVGDQLLTETARIIEKQLRGNDLFARVGGDEFAILLTDTNDGEQLQLIASRIIESLKTSFTISGVQLSTSVSIGIAIFPDDGEDSEQLFKHADIAMYRSKEKGRNCYSFYEPHMYQNYTDKLELEANIHHAIHNHEFSMNFQPQYSMGSLEVLGFEGLIRWNKNGQNINPADFINVAEESHQIIEIGRWVITNAVQALSIWNNNKEKKLTMAINLSVVQLGDATLVKFISDTLRQNGVAPELIEFELTETVLFDDLEHKLEVLNQISDLGCRIALDDFGTGFSSLAHLQNFPIDTIKIDQSMMPESNGDSKNMTIMKSIADMTQELELSCVAEGIETEAQMKICKQLGIDRAQGFLFSKPKSIDDINGDYALDVGSNIASQISIVGENMYAH